MSRIGELADKYYFLGNLRYLSRRITRFPDYYQGKSEARKRANGKQDDRYQKLATLKNLYSGRRCFIVATGPSLTINDLELLKGEVTFGVNSICKVIDQTEWRPTFFGIQDHYVYEKLEDIIKSRFTDNVFVADSLSKEFTLPESYIKFPYYTSYKYFTNSYLQYGAKFSGDAYSVVYDGYSITYSMIEIAVYMGFSEIYLLGCDCSYPKGQKNHFIESGHIDRNEYLNHDRMMAGYREVKKYVDSHDIKVINCTRGGELEIFPRMKLEDVLCKENDK